MVCIVPVVVVEKSNRTGRTRLFVLYEEIQYIGYIILNKIKKPLIRPKARVRICISLVIIPRVLVKVFIICNMILALTVKIYIYICIYKTAEWPRLTTNGQGKK